MPHSRYVASHGLRVISKSFHESPCRSIDIDAITESASHRFPGGTRGALGILANHVGGSFPDHDRRRIGITPYHRGHDRRIRYSQAVDALDPETGIDHRHRIALWAHLAGSDRVVLSISTVTNIPLHTGGIVDPRWVKHLAAH